MGFSLSGFLGGITDALTAPFEAIGDVFGYGVKSLFGQSPMDQYERQLTRNMQYQKDMIDYTNTSNLAYNKDLTTWNNEQNKELADYYYNKYQSPQAMIDSYKKAGINPALALGGSSISPVSSSASSGGASAPSPSATYSYQKAAISSTITEMLERGKQAKLKTKYMKEEVDKLAHDNLVNEAELLSYYTPMLDEHGFPLAESYDSKKRSALDNFSQYKKNQRILEEQLRNTDAAYRLNKLDYDNAQIKMLKDKGLWDKVLEIANLEKSGKNADREYRLLGQKIRQLVNSNDLEDIKTGWLINDWNWRYEDLETTVKLLFGHALGLSSNIMNLLK